MLPKHLDEKVAKLHLKDLGVELEELSDEQADYVIGVKVEGPLSLNITDINLNLDTKIPANCIIIILSIIYLFDLNEYNLNTEIISIITLFIGLIFIISAVIQFINRKTTVNPTKPHKTSTLVITGI